MNTKKAVGTVALALAFVCSWGFADSASAWGDEGHRIIALVAQGYLDASAREQINALLAGDQTQLVARTDMADEATWADHYRDSDRPDGPRYLRTRNWHFVDIELRAPGVNAACHQHPPLPLGVAASQADPNQCVIDKIDQFEAELANPAVALDERRMALQFLLHFVGDVHQPLHAADDHDRGGNGKRVKADGVNAGSLHAYWDTMFVQALGSDDESIAHALLASITPTQRSQWSRGTVVDWAGESFQLARNDVYGRLPSPQADGSYLLDRRYVEHAKEVARLQLSRAGVRLAVLLNKALAGGRGVSVGPAAH